jgi:hypothetical protein
LSAINASHIRDARDTTSTPIAGPDGRANYCHANAEGWPPLDVFNQPTRGVCEASADWHRLRCTERQRKANTNHGSAAQNSAHHRAAVELVPSQAFSRH